MAPDFATTISPRLLMWRRVREYAVPPAMIETATARRAVGDWAGACAAAHIDVDLDLRAARDRHGTELVTRLRADLRRLAPDLLRWHMPRILPNGLLRPGLTIALSHYGSSCRPLQLVVRTPPAQADAGQRMSLALWEHSEPGLSRHLPHPHPSRRFRLDLHRHLWDWHHSNELPVRCGAVPALVSPNLLDVPNLRGVPDMPDLDDRSVLSDCSWASARWAAEAELLLRSEGLPYGPFTVRLGPRSRAVLELVAPDVSHAPTCRPLRKALPAQEIAGLPLLPEAAARPLPDLELLRAGLITSDRLHPLVAKALATTTPPAMTASAAATITASATTSSAAASMTESGLQVGDPHRVECRGEIHRIALRSGVLAAIDHDPVELRREELLVALGGPALPCLRAIDTVQRDPEALPAVRERIGHGDVAGALDVVEGLLGPAVVLCDGPLREELELAAARRVDHGLFRSGLHPAAGVNGNASVSRYVEPGDLPRFDRRTRAAMRPKRRSRVRRSTSLS